MTEIFSAPWFWWAIVIAVALPVSLVVLTEVHNALLRRESYLARPVSLVRNYVLPLGALLLLLLRPPRCAPMRPPSVWSPPCWASSC